MIISSASSNVTWFSSAQVGMPSIDATDPNGLIKVLDACLVMGGINKDVLSVNILDNDVLLNFGSGHGFNLYQNIYISGGDDPLINGTHKVVALTNNTATVKIVGVLATTGAIKAKAAPLGYESIFGNSNSLKRAYRSLADTSSKNVLYLDMGYPDSAGYHSTSPARRAMVDVCSDMQELGIQIGSYTSITNNKPTNKNGSLFWYQSRDSAKATAITSTNVPWTLVGNGDFFYLCVAWSHLSTHKNQNLRDIYGFGDYIGLSESTADTMFLAAITNTDDNAAINTGNLGSQMDTGSTSNHFLINQSAGLKKSPLSITSSSPAATMFSGTLSAPYPSSAGSYLFTHIPKVLGSDNGVIGFAPSLFFIDHAINGVMSDEVVDGVLMVRVQRDLSTFARGANVGFYVGV